jgi:hypothetical protein
VNAWNIERVPLSKTDVGAVKGIKKGGDRVFSKIRDIVFKGLYAKVYLVAHSFDPFGAKGS